MRSIKLNFVDFLTYEYRTRIEREIEDSYFNNLVPRRVARLKKLYFIDHDTLCAYAQRWRFDTYNVNLEFESERNYTLSAALVSNVLEALMNDGQRIYLEHCIRSAIFKNEMYRYTVLNSIEFVGLNTLKADITFCYNDIDFIANDVVLIHI